MFSCCLRSARSSIAIVCRFAADVVAFLGSLSRSRRALIAENVFLRKQLAFYQEHQVKPRRLTDSAQLALVFWSRFFNWRSALVIVHPATLVGWHRKAFRLFWKRKSRPGRPRLPQNLRQLVARMVRENPTWGEERIADELWLETRPSGLSTHDSRLLARRACDSEARPITSLGGVRPQPCPGTTGAATSW